MTGQQASGTQVEILMGTFNGATVLPEQLNSFADQTYAKWQLTCSDDGSTDASAALVKDFASRVPQIVSVQQGRAGGFSANYMGLIAGIGADPDFVAFADQDDIWMPDKLARAVSALHRVSPDRPALYCARRWIWEPQTDHRQATPVPAHPPAFRNALIENIAPGNTIVLNGSAARLARDAARRTGPVFAHDWWLYLLVTGAGGEVVFDSGAPCLLYRQHSDNAIGGRDGLRAQVSRKIKVMKGAFRARVQDNLKAMQAVEDLLTPENTEVLHGFQAALAARGPARLAGLARLRPYRQTALGNFGFWGAALLGRV